jgi:hypothetical protein
MQGGEERRLRRIGNTPQGGAIEDNAADDILMVDQGLLYALTPLVLYNRYSKVYTVKQSIAKSLNRELSY